MAIESSPQTGTVAEIFSISEKPTAPITMAISSLVILAALVVGVGLASHLVLRHIVQTLPLWAGVVLGFRRSRATSWVVLPSFVFWLFLMAVIWSYLAGFTHFINGHFSGIEIAMSIIVAAAAVVGITSMARFQSRVSPLTAFGLFVMMAAIQWGCFRTSFLPAIVHR